MLELLTFIHERLAITSLYFFLIIAVWGYYRFFRKQGLDSAYWGVLAIGEILIIAQGLLGGWLYLAGLRPARDMLHILYGVIIPIMIPGAYLYTRGRGERAEILVYSTAAIIACGLILRAIYTAQVPL
jgi:heme A synthase